MIIKRNFAGRIGTAERSEFPAVGKIGKGEEKLLRFGEMTCIEKLLCLIVFFKKESVRCAGKDG